ncbi:Cx9C motif-containing protein 4, mitochondrial [Exophiala dermatitidis]|nr:Cx9C motif-containing protein 4, mitochondrial [Exophiala dermatitidis]KAJ4505698.1 Cx9C motif-containing protein 4, mitochondrial [Exophiala dermatitidis]KAJ4541096.1 Cx9C motif-containing protein 4, mitochondrial [Exophiala dermatitidis]KAJ4569695.1 Cx9C motif-containing protein 4, mitochondrial [Exophiala dermatitidis]KAJ4588136.1 Cx9C motif-containing protein 4, mitochondrial [Exophiala dermatitidis]
MGKLEDDLKTDPPCHPRAVRTVVPDVIQVVEKELEALRLFRTACLLASIAFALLCMAYRCAIQDCLQKNNYKEEKCQTAIDALYECCNEFYKRQGDEATTASCPKPKLLRVKMKQRGQGD